MSSGWRRLEKFNSGKMFYELTENSSTFKFRPIFIYGQMFPTTVYNKKKKGKKAPLFSMALLLWGVLLDMLGSSLTLRGEMSPVGSSLQ